jgi:hypothetical protein
MLKITHGKGFHIELPNGVTISTQFGGGSYGSNYDMDIGSEARHKELEATEVEVAAWCGEKWITKEYPNNPNGDDVIGYINTTEWLQFLDWCRNYEIKEA